jgi:hypothetical protein
MQCSDPRFPLSAHWLKQSAQHDKTFCRSFIADVQTPAIKYYDKTVAHLLGQLGLSYVGVYCLIFMRQRGSNQSRLTAAMKLRDIMWSMLMPVVVPSDKNVFGKQPLVWRPNSARTTVKLQFAVASLSDHICVFHYVDHRTSKYVT